MRLLVVGPERRDIARVKDYSGVWSHYLVSALENQGVDVAFGPSGGISDHVFALGLARFTRGRESVTRYRALSRGLVTQYYDRPMSDAWEVDCTFTACDDEGMPRNHCIGWAADPTILQPVQSADELTLLVDHPDYNPARLKQDRTTDIVQSIKFFIEDRTELWLGRWRRVNVLGIVNGGVSEINLRYNFVVSPFTRRHIPFQDIAKQYGRAHVFFPTHKENVGITCLEAAMCGALVVAPRGMIPADRLQTIRHIEYDHAIPWGRVLDSIDISASREMARQNSWSRVARRMIDYLESHNA